MKTKNAVLKNYLSDRDSKGFDVIEQIESYGNEFQINQLHWDKDRVMVKLQLYFRKSASENVGDFKSMKLSL